MKPSKKQTRNEKVTAAPGPLKLGERTYLVLPPTPADMLSLRKYLRGRHRKERATAAGDALPGLRSEELAGLTPEDRLAVLREFARTKATDTGGKSTMTEDEAFDLLQDPDGASYMIWLSARRHQTVTLEEIRAAITDDNVDQILEDFDEASGAEDPETGDIDPKAPGSDTSGP
jgi:hypothetical protein